MYHERILESIEKPLLLLVIKVLSMFQEVVFEILGFPSIIINYVFLLIRAILLSWASLFD